MKLNNSITTILLASIFFMSIGCKKDGCTDKSALNYDEKDGKDDGTCTYPEPEPEVTVTFTFLSPDGSVMYGLGDTVKIDVKILGSDHLHGYAARIINTSNSNEEVWSASSEEHDESYEVSGIWINDVTMHSNMKLEVDALIDHDGTKKTETKEFHCHPM